ncbi:hypothetical protein D3C80_2032090 [compost metagenome]
MAMVVMICIRGLNRVASRVPFIFPWPSTTIMARRRASARRPSWTPALRMADSCRGIHSVSPASSDFPSCRARSASSRQSTTGGLGFFPS